MPHKNQVSATLTSDANDYSTSSDSFDIREYIDRLEKSKAAKNKYHCPVCGGNDFWIDSKTGKYACLNNQCSSEEIREAIAPWAESPRNPKNKDGNDSRSHHNHRSRKPQKKHKLQPAPIPETVELAKFTPSDFPEQQGNKTIYKYNDDQWVERTDTPTGKKVLPFHSDFGSNKVGKGDNKSWPMYRELEAIAHGQGKFVLMVEGEKCVELPRSIGLVAVTFQGGSWTPSEIESAILRLKGSGIAGIAYFPDNDEPGLKKAEKVSDACAKWEVPCVKVLPETLGISQDKGDIADYITEKLAQGAMAPEQVRDALERIFQESAERHRSLHQQLMEIVHSQEAEERPATEKKYDTDWADEIAELYRDTLAWDSAAKEWRRYEKGIWSAISEEEIVQVIKFYIQSQGKGCRMGQISSIEKLMRANLYRKKWDENPNLIPFEDGDFDLGSNKLLPHSPAHNLTWQLPRKYHSEVDSWEKIDSWLSFAVQENQRDKDILIAFAAATLRGRADLHKFLLVQGLGGTGKSSYIRLLEDLVGTENHYSSSLSEWNNTRFESANGYGKRLLSFPDENGKARNIEGFKKLTGQDLVRFEEKGKKATNYRFNGMVVVASNSSPFVGGSSSAIARRKIEISFNAVVPASQRCDINAKFQDELSAFTRYLLNLDNEWITQVLRNQQGFGSLTADTWDKQCQNDSIAAWLDEWVIFDPSFSVPVGNQKAGLEEQNECFTLYQSYTLYCMRNGYLPKATRRFSADLLEMGTVLNQTWKKVHTRHGKKIQGLRLRNSELDVNIPTYTEILESQNQPQNDPVTDNVTDGDGCVTDNVTDVTLAVTGRDGCDGFNPTFSEKNLPQPTDATPDDTQIASNEPLSDEDISEMIENLCRCEHKEELLVLVETYERDYPQVKKRVWEKMTPEQRGKAKAILNILPNGVKVGKEYEAPIGETVKLLEVFEQTNREGYPYLMGRCEYISDGKPCEVRLTMLKGVVT